MIHSDTPVHLTMKHVWAFAGTLAAAAIVMMGVFWKIVDTTYGSVRDDMSFVKQNISKLQGDDMNGAVHLRETEAKLAGEIAKLNTNVVVLSGKIDNYNESVASLSHRLDDFQKQLAMRQASIESPKAAYNFAALLKKAGLDDKNIVVVPFDSGLSSGVYYPGGQAPETPKPPAPAPQPLFGPAIAPRQ